MVIVQTGGGEHPVKTNKRPGKEEKQFQCDLCQTTTNDIYNKMPLCPDHVEQVQKYRAERRKTLERTGKTS
jgi:hypothetical protein